MTEPYVTSVRARARARIERIPFYSFPGAMTDQMEYSPVEIRRVRKIQFGVLNPEEVRAMSVCKVANPMTYENGVPKVHSLTDC